MPVKSPRLCAPARARGGEYVRSRTAARGGGGGAADALRQWGGEGPAGGGPTAARQEGAGPAGGLSLTFAGSPSLQAAAPGP